MKKFSLQKNGGFSKKLQIMVLVFKTSIFSQLEIHVRAILDTFKQISSIDFDFEDVDKILRIESSEDLTSDIELLLNSKGFYCEELT